MGLLLLGAGRRAAAGGGGGGAVTATWQNLTLATTDGNGGITSSGGQGVGRTTETITGDGYFEFTYRTPDVTIGIQNGTFAGTGDSEIDCRLYFNSIEARFDVNGTGYAYLGATVSGDVWRIEKSGTSVLVIKNGTTIHTATSQTFSDPYYGSFYGFGTGTRIDAAKVLA